MNGSQNGQSVEYKGHLFRSHEDARWAVFFDAIEAPWEYMQREVKLASAAHRPRFWLPLTGHARDCFPKGGRWFDCGPEPGDTELKLVTEVASVSGHHFFRATGTAGRPAQMAVIARARREYEGFRRALAGPLLAEPILAAILPERIRLNVAGEFTGPFAAEAVRCPLAPQLALLVRVDHSKYGDVEDETADVARRLYRAHWLARTTVFAAHRP